MLYQSNINLEDPIIQQLIVFAGGNISKKTTMLGDIYYNIQISYRKEEPINWINVLKNNIINN